MKHSRGKNLKKPQVWLFGLYERPLIRGERGHVPFFVVPKRDAYTLLNIIYKHVARDSIIHSDRWSAYTRIRQLDKNLTEKLTTNCILSTQKTFTRIRSNLCGAKSSNTWKLVAYTWLLTLTSLFGGITIQSKPRLSEFTLNLSILFRLRLKSSSS